MKLVSKYGLNFDVELDLTNVLNIGYNHSLETIRVSEQKLKGPLSKAYIKDLYLICHKLVLTKILHNVWKRYCTIIRKDYRASYDK